MGGQGKKESGQNKKRVVCVTHTNGTIRRKEELDGRERREGNGGRIEQLAGIIVYRTGCRMGTERRTRRKTKDQKKEKKRRDPSGEDERNIK